MADENGAALPRPATMRIATSALRELTADGRKRFKVFAIAMSPDGFPIVIADAVIDVPNLDIARILVAGITDALNKQPPEILHP